jgi:DNA-binding transcriptional ArsR family regulator
MANSKADLILHPVRMRVLMALAGREMTAQALAAALADVPHATLYRHINRLTAAGLLTVVEVRPVRGTTEKVYALNQGASSLGADELADANPEDHMRYFTAFVASLLSDFERYLAGDNIVVTREVSYHKFPLYLNDAELQRATETINQTLAPLLSNGPGEGRRRVILTSMMMPAADDAEPNDTK